ncbi:sporulation integral membrane protein YtvI [Meiothermus luteus]|jgi:predicted PurR-regulated permease PerM|uniref:Sporulation integral membrane protein YtvI n=1 Tax=Meiothermus luteus TaxID=2026184 RepID=A0A399EFZ2_9DEIN|nr:AI-2E family transporter [Meiothermus luteus]RIH82666.1 sporulation integral membrane protein YtvI [Meiothermus luteus]RMH54125.1 MAG: AI-2E family transporter [Deinococcota bacterium]
MRETLEWAWQNPWMRFLAYLALMVLGFAVLSWVVNGARGALGIVAAAFVFSYVVSPVVAWFEARGLGRALGVAVVFVGMLLILAFSTVLLASMVGQLAQLAAGLPRLLQPLVSWVQGLPDQIGQVELPPVLLEALTQATLNLQDLLAAFTQLLLQALQGVLARGGNLLGFFSFLLGGAFQLLTVITLSIYLLYDLPRVGAAIFKVIPEPFQPTAKELARKADLAFGGYVRGTILGAVANGWVVALAMYLSFGAFQGFGLEVLTQATVLGFLAFVFSFVPVLGVIISAIPALVLALPLGWLAFGVVAFALWLCNQISGFIWPIIMGRTTSLHPVTGIAAVLIGASLMGLGGALLAVPLTAFLKLLYTDYYLRSRFYREG